MNNKVYLTAEIKISNQSNAVLSKCPNANITIDETAENHNHFFVF